jgi:hypothetical protein
VIGVHVSVNNVLDSHPLGFSRSEIKVGIINRVAHGGQTFATSTEQVRGGNDRINVQKLPKNHDRLPLIKLGFARFL